MTREEALRRLQGTWTFELVAGRVPVREVALQRALREEESALHDAVFERPLSGRTNAPCAAHRQGRRTARTVASAA